MVVCVWGGGLNRYTNLTANPPGSEGHLFGTESISAEPRQSSVVTVVALASKDAGALLSEKLPKAVTGDLLEKEAPKSGTSIITS